MKKECDKKEKAIKQRKEGMKKKKKISPDRRML